MSDFDSVIPSPEEIAEVEFQMFFDDLQTLKYRLTHDYSQFKLIGLSLDQERFIDLFRYHVMKVMQVFSQHPLYPVVYRENVLSDFFSVGRKGDKHDESSS